jgi:GntR family transcriptional regulator/MocR family aminotransferase
LTEAPLAEFLAQGHFAAHLRRVRRRVKAARDVLVQTLRAHGGKRLDVAIPQQGLHLVAKLRSGKPDTEIAAAAQAAGAGARALSPMFIAAAPAQGLVLGFSGFASEAVRDAAIRLCGILGA